MGLRTYALPLAGATTPVRLSDVYGGLAGLVDAATDIPYRELRFAGAAGVVVGAPVASSTAPPATITRVASVATAPGPNGGTTAPIDTTGATLLVVSVAWYTGGGAVVLSDSRGNSWVGLTQWTGGGAGQRLWYCLSPLVGAGHTVTVSGASIYPAVFVYAFAGVGSYQTESGVLGGATPPVASGSVTPTASGALIVTGHAASNVTSNESMTPAGFTIAQVPYNISTNVFGAAGYLVQPTAAPINPTVSWTGASVDNQVATAVFLPAGAATPSYQARILGDGAIAYWPLDDVASPVRDLAGARPGVVQGTGVAPLYQQPGVGGAGSVEISSAGFDIPPLPTLLPQFTYEAWVKFTGGAVNRAILSRLGVHRWWIVSPGPAGRRALQVFLGTSYNLQTPADGLLTFGSWFHVAVTHDGTTGRLYLNGVLDATLAFPLPPGDSPTIASSLGYDLNSGTYLVGGLQDVAVYSKALSPQTIADHYAARLVVPLTLVGLPAPFKLGPFMTGPLKLSHLYATGTGSLQITGVPY